MENVCGECGYGLGYTAFENGTGGFLRKFRAKYHVVCKYNNPRAYRKAITDSQEARARRYMRNLENLQNDSRVMWEPPYGLARLFHRVQGV